MKREKAFQTVAYGSWSFVLGDQNTKRAKHGSVSARLFSVPG